MPLSGSEEFIECILGRTFLSPVNHVQLMKGCEVSGHALLNNGFEKPILVNVKDGLRIRVPPVDFKAEDLLKYIDSNLMVDVINVREQTELQMNLGDFIGHFLAKNRSLLLNMLSLEFSHTRLSNLVEPPHVVSELSLIRNCWVSADEEADGCSDDESLCSTAPSVQKYCLLSMKGSYTDFHIDFGGSSVWYHVLWGEKIFYLIPPTTENRASYWRWTFSSRHRAVFLPDILCNEMHGAGTPPKPPVFQLRVGPGETILLPAGWIHAVYTPSDCLVFGGNFLNELHIPMQLSVYRMEQKSGTPRKFQFPNFEKVHWFVAERIAGRLTNALYDNREPPKHEIDAARALVKALPRWLEKRLPLPSDERLYYLPSRTTMELPYSRLIERLEELLMAFVPTSGNNPKNLIKSRSELLKLKKPDKTLDSNTSCCKKFADKYSKVSSSSSPSSKHSVGGGLGWIPDRAARAKASSANTQSSATNQPVTDDQDILDALPELKDSRSVGDYYFLDLSDSDAEETNSQKYKCTHSTRRTQSSHKARDPDPTWSGAGLSPRKGSGRSLKTSSGFLLPLPSKSGLPKRNLTGDRLHPLLRDSEETALKASKSSSSKSAKASHKKPVTPVPTTSTVRTSTKSKSSSVSQTTVKQRLAKRLGL